MSTPNIIIARASSVRNAAFQFEEAGLARLESFLREGGRIAHADEVSIDDFMESRAAALDCSRTLYYSCAMRRDTKAPAEESTGAQPPLETAMTIVEAIIKLAEDRLDDQECRTECYAVDGSHEQHQQAIEACRQAWDGHLFLLQSHKIWSLLQSGTITLLPKTKSLLEAEFTAEKITYVKPNFVGTTRNFAEAFQAGMSRLPSHKHFCYYISPKLAEFQDDFKQWSNEKAAEARPEPDTSTNMTFADSLKSTTNSTALTPSMAQSTGGASTPLVPFTYIDKDGVRSTSWYAPVVETPKPRRVHIRASRKIAERQASRSDRAFEQPAPLRKSAVQDSMLAAVAADSGSQKSSIARELFDADIKTPPLQRRSSVSPGPGEAERSDGPESIVTSFADLADPTMGPEDAEDVDVVDEIPGSMPAELSLRDPAVLPAATNVGRTKDDLPPDASGQTPNLIGKAKPLLETIEQSKTAPVSLRVNEKLMEIVDGGKKWKGKQKFSSRAELGVRISVLLKKKTTKPTVMLLLEDVDEPRARAITAGADEPGPIGQQSIFNAPTSCTLIVRFHKPTECFLVFPTAEAQVDVQSASIAEMLSLGLQLKTTAKENWPDNKTRWKCNTGSDHMLSAVLFRRVPDSMSPNAQNGESAVMEDKKPEASGAMTMGSSSAGTVVGNGSVVEIGLSSFALAIGVIVLMVLGYLGMQTLRAAAQRTGL